MITWSQVSGPTGGFTTFSNNGPNTTADFNIPGTYEIEVSIALGPCITAELVTVIAVGQIEVTNVFAACDPTNGTYQVSFDISGGTTPYLVDGIPIGGTTYTSAPISIGVPYSFEVTDNGNCPSVIVQGIDNCGCISDAGTMLPSFIQACLGDEVIVTVSTEILDANDLGLYILHDNPGTSLGAIFDSNTSGLFSFLPLMTPGQSYYVSFVVGNDMAGSIDFNDPCLAVALGAEVIWNKFPSINPIPDQSS